MRQAEQPANEAKRTNKDPDDRPQTIKTGSNVAVSTGVDAS